jgi:hypothetical protein
MIAVAILGIGSTLAYSHISNLKKIVEQLKLKKQIADMRSFVMQTTDCSKTLKPLIQSDGSISCNGTIELKNAEDSFFTQNPINKFQISATCSTATGLKVLAESTSQAKDPVTKLALNHSNTTLNPVVGRGSAYGLCENWFRGSKRVRVFAVQPTELPYSSSECTRVLTQNFETPGTPMSKADLDLQTQTWSQNYLLVNTLDVRCTNFCRANPRFYVGGYIADCNSSEATCVCFR